ncbi:MAG TPA: class I SAM-dependent methyltransferase [Hyphomonadaceae bacterium]|nr:class I SAM-dependent methyltransferase [Hyphomonadaceae bacterium]
MADENSVDHYGASYGNFASDLAAQIRREAFGEDIGQNGWQTADEQDIFIQWLKLSASSRLLDFACGAGGPALRICETTGARVDGIDIDARAIAAGRAMAGERNLADRVAFHVGDGGSRLPFGDATFNAVISIDAVNHIPDRAAMFAEWRRVLKPGGVALFTDPAVITGPISGEELRIRSSIGSFLFTPPGADESFLKAAGFALIERLDRTANMGRSARGRQTARARHEADLCKLEGEATFERQQIFFETAARLAEEGRLSRIAFLARS